MTAAAQLSLIPDEAPDAEAVILVLLGAIYGDGGKDRGLMTRTHQGTRHLARCTVGYYVQAGDSQRGGAPCGGRCLVLRDAAVVAAVWLKAHEQQQQARPPISAAG